MKKNKQYQMVDGNIVIFDHDSATAANTTPTPAYPATSSFYPHEPSPTGCTRSELCGTSRKAFPLRTQP